MPVFAYIILSIGFLAWLLPFFLVSRHRPGPVLVDRRARWGVALQCLAFAVIWQGDFWQRTPEIWRVTMSIIFLACAAAFSWSAPRSLGRQWRIDAGLNVDHQLVQSGVYALVRHPIYVSMLCLLLGVGFMISRLSFLTAATALMILGTEIRVRLEECLLASRFGAVFDAYRRRVPAYVPLRPLIILITASRRSGRLRESTPPGS